MPILVPCPGCGAKLNAPDSTAGLMLRCPKCKADVLVPDPEVHPPKQSARVPPPLLPAAIILPDDEDPPPRRTKRNRRREPERDYGPIREVAAEEPDEAPGSWKLVSYGCLVLVISYGVFAASILAACGERLVIVRSAENVTRTSLNTLIGLMIAELILKFLSMLGWLAGRVLFGFGPPGRVRALTLTSAGIAGGGFLFAFIGMIMIAIDLRSSAQSSAGTIAAGAMISLLGSILAIAAEYVGIVAQMAFAHRWRNRAVHTRSKIQLIALSVLLAGFVVGFCLFRGVSNLAEETEETNFGYGKLVTRKKDADVEATLVGLTALWLVFGVGGYCAWSAFTVYGARTQLAQSPPPRFGEGAGGRG